MGDTWERGYLLLGTLRRAFGLIGPGRRRRYGLIAAMAVVTSALEAVSAVLILVLMQLVLEPGVLPTLPILGSTDGVLGRYDYDQVVIGFAVTFAVFYALRSLAFLAQTYGVARLAEHTGALLAGRLVAGYLRMPYSFHLSRNSAQLIRNAYDNVSQVQAAVFSQFGTVVAELILSFGLLVVLLLASPAATGAVVVLMLGSLLLVMRFVQPRLKILGRQRNVGAQGALQHLQQGLGGVRDVKILGREAEFSRAFQRSRMEMARPQYLRAALAYLPRMVIEGAFLGFVLVVLVLAVISGATSDLLATLGLFAYAGLRLQPSVQKIAGALNSIRFAGAAVDDLHEDLQLLTASGGTEESGPVEAMTFADEVVFDGVTFSYEGAERPALEGLDLRVRAGERIGVCGPSGGGKTTFVDVLCGLLEPTKGRVLVDGQPIRGRVRGWQRNIGAVHQTSFLVDGTLRENIAFGVAPKQIDDDRVRRAIQIAALDGVLAELPHGLDTVMGERGVRLSGGQRQRVTLARALYRDPRLLVLDEGTSALDTATEATIMAHLEVLPSDTTLVMVAHRLSTLQVCDRILVFEQGRLTGEGRYDELLACHEGFRALATGPVGSEQLARSSRVESETPDGQLEGRMTKSRAQPGQGAVT